MLRIILLQLLTTVIAALVAMMEQQAQAGWVWDDLHQTLTHPHDRQLFFRIEPGTRRLSLSPKLTQRLSDGLGPQPQAEQP